jgi:hypothetical protein
MKQPLVKWLIASGLGLLSACTSSFSLLEDDASFHYPFTPRRALPPPQELTLWVDEELVPYLIKQFNYHPRFKGQRFLVVSMRGDEVQPEMDSLTRYIRDRVRTTLLQTPGINALWQPPILPGQHARHLADLPCGEFNQIQYYVGVDIQHSPLDGTVEVSVRALDVGEKRWVSGFHQSWRGQLSLAQRQKLNRRHKDESLRGLRTLPFTANQPDLLAAYLAHNLGCLLRYHPTAEEIVLYPPSPDGNETLPYFRTVLGLVGNYLGRFREVQLTDDPKQATVTLESHIYSLHGDLHQVWVTLRYTQNRRAFTGAETEAYVYLSPTSARREEKPVLQPKATPWAAPPQPQLYGSLRRSDPVASETLSPTSSSATSRSEKLLGKLRLSSIANRNECIPKSRRFGERWAGFLGKTTSASPCLAVEVAVNRATRLVLVGQNSRGQLRWLTPAACHDEHPAGIHLPAGKTFRFPLLPDQVQFLELDRNLGQSWVYAIAVAEQAVDEILDERWIHIRGSIAKKLHHNSSSYTRAIVNRLGLCDQRWRNQRPASAWINDLKTVAAESTPQMEWQGIRLWHSKDPRL